MWEEPKCSVLSATREAAFLMAERRPRLSRDKLYDLFIKAGWDILREEGLGAGGETLTLKRVRERVESDTGIQVTNASLIGRIWENQSDYQTDVLATIAAHYGTSEIEDTIDSLTPVLTSMDPSSEESRRSTMREVCRVSAAANTTALRYSTDLSLWFGIWAVTAVGSAPERRRRIESALEQSYEKVTERMEGIYTAGLDFVGYRARPGLTIRQFTIAAAALAEGCVLRDRVDSAHMNGIMRPTGPGGEEQEWTLFGLALDALAQQFFELDPDWAVTAVDSPSASAVLDA
jgi:hypothetical protein